MSQKTKENFRAIRMIPLSESILVMRPPPVLLQLLLSNLIPCKMPPGTTYSCVAVFKEGNIEIVANDLGERTTPSWVAFTDSDRLIGQAAKNQVHKNPKNTLYALPAPPVSIFCNIHIQIRYKAPHWPRVWRRRGSEGHQGVSLFCRRPQRQTIPQRQESRKNTEFVTGRSFSNGAHANER